MQNRLTVSNHSDTNQGKPVTDEWVKEINASCIIMVMNVVYQRGFLFVFGWCEDEPNCLMEVPKHAI